jgi:DNA-binding GntR family transcriptional regulator
MYYNRHASSASDEEESMTEEELSRRSLYLYLSYVKLAVRVANEKLDLENLDQEQCEQLAMRQGTAMLAQEIITRYGLAPAPEDN